MTPSEPMVPSDESTAPGRRKRADDEVEVLANGGLGALLLRAVFRKGALELEGEFEDDDLLDLDGDEACEVLAPSGELQRVARRISGQYVEVLAAFASAMFTGRIIADSDSIHGSVDALRRLAVASQDHAQLELLDRLDELIVVFAAGESQTRAHQSALVALRDWIPDFADTLASDDGENLRSLVSWSPGSVPLLEELAHLNGIGPKRLQRLYAAGFYTVAATANAVPLELAQVTGLPRKLAFEVVTAARGFAEEEHRKCLVALQDRAVRLRKMLVVKAANPEELREMARHALAEIQTTLAMLE